ncbi:redox-sensitive transcriptional regulator HypR [Staphylococcus warneri]|uniref:redox-sensitive transcriptional regulator HypR n=1 Tax=Staphylococcus warneri TaxID=1292 RepID=UPI00326076D1
MNLAFNIAIHVLAFLAKHNHQRYHSTELAELTCINPVQLRRVAALLTHYGYINTILGNGGGYQANDITNHVKLSDLYQSFVLDKRTNQKRIFTGNQSSHCVIARHIEDTMTYHHNQEDKHILNYYSSITIQDIIQQIHQEDNNND